MAADPWSFYGPQLPGVLTGWDDPSLKLVPDVSVINALNAQRLGVSSSPLPNNSVQYVAVPTPQALAVTAWDTGAAPAMPGGLSGRSGLLLLAALGVGLFLLRGR